MDPLGILLVNARGAGGGALGQRTDGDQTLDDCMGVLLALGDRLDQGLVAIRHRLHWVVPVAGQHALLETADDLGTFSSRTHVWDGDWTHAGGPRLARVRVGLAILAVNSDALGTTVHSVP